MSIKSLAIYTVSLTLGIGAVTNAKALMIEQAPQPQEAAQIAKSYRPGGVQHRRYRMRPSFIPRNHWRESKGLVISYNPCVVDSCLATGGWAFTEEYGN